MPRVKTGLNALATGTLIFVLWDVLAHAWERSPCALGFATDGIVTAAGA